ncbi:MAG TPA: glycoside hydrolase family 88 protein [Chthoniobacterales bacterium]|nr:glycoside hydrolase family 88 protein [Chthoniobacterales bacterium]
MKTIDLVKVALLAMQRNSWEQGVAMDAFLEQGDRDVVVALAKEAAYRRTPDGRPAMIRPDEGITDPCSVGEGLIFAFQETDDKELGDACDSLLNWALKSAPRNHNGIVYHVPNRSEFWIDSMYMLPPYLAAAGYPEEALHQIYGYRAALFDPQAGLFSHKWDDEKQAFLRKDFWGVGNGWTAAGLARTIDLLPEAMSSQKQELVQITRALVDCLLKYKRSDWLFHDVVDDPGTFVEVNLSQMLAYTIYRGLIAGWLPRAYENAGRSLRQAVSGKVDRFGLVQGVCGAPHFDRPGVAAEGQSFYLMLDAAAKRWARLCQTCR